MKDLHQANLRSVQKGAPSPSALTSVRSASDLEQSRRLLRQQRPATAPVNGARPRQATSAWPIDEAFFARDSFNAIVGGRPPKPEFDLTRSMMCTKSMGRQAEL